MKSRVKYVAVHLDLSSHQVCTERNMSVVCVCLWIFFSEKRVWFMASVYLCLFVYLRVCLCVGVCMREWVFLYHKNNS